jgi:Protein of unknown function (DUF3106)
MWQRIRRGLRQLSRGCAEARRSAREDRLGKMRPGKYRADWLAAVGLAIAFAIPLPCLAYGSAFQGAQQRHAAPAPPQQHQQPPRQPQARPQAAGHAGDWLRRYKDLAPAEQERALQNDPAFRRLPPARQQILRDRLQRFSNLPPQQQLRVLNRMETWEHLTPEQKQQARQVYGQMRQLPPDRQRMVTTAVRDLRAMPPDQREKVINSDRFKGMFSDQEREMMRGATRLPLAPAEGGENEPQQ